MPAAARAPWSGAGVFLSGLAVVATVAFADGGYFPESWTWIVIALCSLAGIAVVSRERIVLSRLELGTMGALGAFAVWVALSATWSSAPSDSVDEAERALIYVAAILAFPLLVGPGRARELLGGVAVGIALVAGYSLGGRLFPGEPIEPDPVAGTRLIEPLGYANALGILAVVGIVLSLGFAVYGPTRLERALGAAAPMLLLPTLTLTESRGSWIALAVGLGAWALLETRRARLLATAFVLTLPAVAAVWLTENSSALTDEGSTLGELSKAGRELALALGFLAAVSVLASLRAPWVETHMPRPLTWVSYVLLPSVLVAMTAGATLRPRRSLDVRTDYWRVAWDQFEANVWLGSGAGTFVQYWQRSGIPAGVRDAHSLYLETLAELGPIGLALLLVALGLPLLAALRARRHPFVAVAAGAFVAYLVHAGLDWDWEMPAVTLTGLLCAVALLSAARCDQAPIVVGPRARTGLLVVAVAIGALAFASRAFGG